jgi:hypothetical protein
MFAAIEDVYGVLHKIIIPLAQSAGNSILG